jgi:hypothetical protein
LKPRKGLKNAQTPTCRLHVLLDGGGCEAGIGCEPYIQKVFAAQNPNGSWDDMALETETTVTRYNSAAMTLLAGEK